MGSTRSVRASGERMSAPGAVDGRACGLGMGGCCRCPADVIDASTLTIHLQTIQQGTRPRPQARQAQHPPEHLPPPDRRRRQQGGRPVLPWKGAPIRSPLPSIGMANRTTARRVRVPRKEGDPGLQGPRHLGVSLPATPSPRRPDVRARRRVTRPHGNAGVVKSKFRSNLPPHAFGASVRIVRPTPSPCLPSADSHSGADALPVEYLTRHCIPVAFFGFVLTIYCIMTCPMASMHPSRVNTHV
jgi:Ribosomal protein L35Ae